MQFGEKIACAKVQRKGKTISYGKSEVEKTRKAQENLQGEAAPSEF
jgi:hypothetical protein